MASLKYRSSRLVRSLDTQTGRRMGFGVESDSEVVSARYDLHDVLAPSPFLLKYSPHYTEAYARAGGRLFHCKVTFMPIKKPPTGPAIHQKKHVGKGW